MNYGSSISSWKLWWWMRLDLVLPMRDIYISIPTWTQNSLRAAEETSLNISSHVTLSSDHKECPNQHKNSQNLFNKMGHPVVNLMESQWKLKHNMIRCSQWRQSHCRTNTSIRRKKKIQKSRTMIITVWDLFLFYFCNYFCLSKLYLRCCIRPELNILTWFTKVLKVLRVTPMIWRKYGKLILLDALKIHFKKLFTH